MASAAPGETVVVIESLVVRRLAVSSIARLDLRTADTLRRRMKGDGNIYFGVAMRARLPLKDLLACAQIKPSGTARLNRLDCSHPPRGGVYRGQILPRSSRERELFAGHAPANSRSWKIGPSADMRLGRDRWRKLRILLGRRTAEKEQDEREENCTQDWRYGFHRDRLGLTRARSGAASGSAQGCEMEGSSHGKRGGTAARSQLHRPVRCFDAAVHAD